jgi:hypothetical protein
MIYGRLGKDCPVDGDVQKCLRGGVERHSINAIRDAAIVA